MRRFSHFFENIKNFQGIVKFDAIGKEQIIIVQMKHFHAYFKNKNTQQVVKLKLKRFEKVDKNLYFHRRIEEF